MNANPARTLSSRPTAVAIGTALIAAFFGIALVILPMGFFFRVFVVFAAAFTLLLAWLARSEQNRVPNRLIFFLMMLIVSLSVVWPRYVFFRFEPLPRINPYTVSIMLGLCLLLLFVLISPEFGRRISGTMRRGGWVVKLTLLWFAWRLIASILGEYPFASTINLLREMTYIGSFLLFGVVIASFENGPRYLFRALVLMGFVVAVLGVVEAFQHKNLFVRFASQGEEGDLAAVLSNIALSKIRMGDYRAQSTFDHPIVFAQFCAALMPLATYGLLYEKRWFWRLISLLIIPIALLAVLKSGSRAGIVSFAIAAVFLGVLLWLRAMAHGRFSRVAAIIALPGMFAAIGIAYVVSMYLVEGRSAVEAGSTSVRLLMIRYGIDALWQSPLWGFGYGLATTKAGIASPLGVVTIDNYLLSIALDSGYVGLGLFVAMIVVYALKGFTIAVQRRSEEGMFVGACVAGVLALSVTFAILSIPNNMTLLWLLVTASFPLFCTVDPKKSD